MKDFTRISAVALKALENDGKELVENRTARAKICMLKYEHINYA